MAPRRPICAGNWKLFKAIAEAQGFFSEVRAMGGFPSGIDVIIAPTALALAAAKGASEGMNVGIAAQNCYEKNTGAFTGEVSPLLVKAAGGTSVLLGHSERRAIFGEGDTLINRKVRAVQKEGLVPVLCVGETLDERSAGKVEEVLERQLVYGLEAIEIPNPASFVIAYEPVWAIGTGRTAGPADAQGAHSFIRRVISRMFGEDTAGGMRLLYGGSVNPGNTNALCQGQDVDGVLVGGASLDPKSFLEIAAALAQAKGI